ncbi:nucleotide exchange factor GrpE [Anaerosphaera multitolerans]|uniref:Protein GrpE n=1 Tax=Anaerosphaera multitolerans TaxID=2487351 RepID=A0A437S928_9FIRM|nr:nucleotide exchange factor GrpE [Anaerosphaera multitolerans]RVU55338.1 nucleotide exchange factor GrpE [Anaerosphaera multitolerans]
MNNEERDLIEEKTEEVIEEKTVEEKESLSQEAEAKEAENNEKDSELDLIKDKFVRLQADFINFKRRTESEKKDYVELGIEKIILGLLPIIDNFERALDANTEKNSFSEGVEMIYVQLLELLEKNDVEEIEALNAEFNPNIHHAVLVEPKEGVKEGMVIEVLQKGYKLGERVLRPSMVKVSQ